MAEPAKSGVLAKPGASTIKTSPQGLMSKVSTAKKSLLGY